MIGIYKIENLINGKVYIGQSSNILKRWSTHKSFANSLVNSRNTHLYNAIKKYGIENFSFEIIEETSIEDLNKREIYWIKYYNSYEKGYNLTIGGEGIKKVTEEDIEKICQYWRNGLSVGEIVEKTQYCVSTILSYLKAQEPTYSSEDGYERGEKYRIKKGIALNKFLEIDCFNLYNDYLFSFHLISNAEKYCQADNSAIYLCCEGKNFSANGYRFSYHQQPLKYNGTRTNTCPIIKIDNNNNQQKTYYPNIETASKLNNCCKVTIFKHIKNKTLTKDNIQWEKVKYNYSPIIDNYIFYDDNDNNEIKNRKENQELKYD